MPRKSITVTIDGSDPFMARDAGKVFRITELPATQAERWALRAFMAMAKAGVDIPENISSAGLAGLMSIGLGALSKIEFHDALALMDEMWTCVQIQPDPNESRTVRGLIESDVEEVPTRLFLRRQTLGLHVNFSIPADG